ncbi:MAG: ribonuclease P protein component [Candidatus Yanofskybacteria bacterium RIFCSPLOWO2_01_FULL_49_25]|uniref:Ribonuclease P protein component n=1 Tax=Candidatus Yanofskybacteria bacterium RIFCSPLOWO2_01_FULL_49_25 TaxID=1802701 RepID=A0A1F8GXR7_9BACT|nr:MAG: ribonuclease P protein component [Candidatus Yanofskybacteria bacterium RIFCSPLOWO2_01_FULL_49_25]
MALSRLHRLSSRKDIDEVFKKGRTTRGTFFFIRYCAVENGIGRVAVSVSKNIARKAVDRTFLRRVYTNLAAICGLDKLSFDLVIVPTQLIVGKAREEIKRDFEETTKKLR